MTYQEFLEKLSQTPRDWKLMGPYEAGCPGEKLIRLGCECPLDSVVPGWDRRRSAFSEPCWMSAVRRASDGHTLLVGHKANCYWPTPPEDPMYFGAIESCRADLLRACGLEGR